MSDNFSEINEPLIPEPERDTAATKENESEVPDYDKKVGELDNSHALGYRKLFFGLAKAGIILIFVLLSSLTLIWAWHILAPEGKRWLEAKEVQAIERLLFSSVLVSVGGRYFSKYKLLGKKE